MQSINGVQRAQDLRDFNKLANLASKKTTRGSQKLLLPPIKSHRDRTSSNIVTLLEHTPTLKELFSPRLPFSGSETGRYLGGSPKQLPYIEYSMDFEDDMMREEQEKQQIVTFIRLIMNNAVMDACRKKHEAIQKQQERKLLMSKRFHIKVKGNI